jgi:hypothetical protein
MPSIEPIRPSPVSRPPVVATYSPAYTPAFQPVYGPAAIVTLSEAAQNWLREQRASRPKNG